MLCETDEYVLSHSTSAPLHHIFGDQVKEKCGFKTVLVTSKYFQIS